MRIEGVKIANVETRSANADRRWSLMSVLPFYEAKGVLVQAVLSDNGREYCGRPERHPCELPLALHDIEHRRTKIHNPRANGFVERMNRTLLDEYFRIKARTTWQVSPEEIQCDPDQYLSFNNLKLNARWCWLHRLQIKRFIDKPKG